MKKIKPILLVITFILLINAAFTYGLQENSIQQPLNFSSLSWELSSPREEYVELEPIQIVLTLCNKMQQPALGHDSIELVNNHVKLFVQHENGERQKVRQLSTILKHIRVTPQLVKPGECHQAKDLLSLNLPEVFPHHGTYQIQAVVNEAQGNEEIPSNLITIRIVKPSGRDLSAYNYIKGKDGNLFFTGFQKSGAEKVKDRLEEFVSVYGDTTYVDYADFLLGEIYFGQKDYKKAVKHFSKLEVKPHFVLSEKASKYLKKIKERIPDPESSQI